MLCNILEYCSQTLDVHGLKVLQPNSIFYLLLYNYWKQVIEYIFAEEWHIILKL
jgi:hypothetical protein